MNARKRKGKKVNNNYTDQHWKTLRLKEAVHQQRQQHLLKMDILDKEKKAAEAALELANLKVLLFREENNC